MSFISSATVSAGQLIGDAAAPYALILSAQRFMGTIIPDVTVRETHIDEDTITQNPVETGTPVADHVFANPQVIEIQCGFSDSDAGVSGYVQEIYQALLALKATREPFDVSTGKRYYSNMLFSSVVVVTDETSEFALMVVARLQQVIITDTGGTTSTQQNQENPQQTGPETSVGTQNLTPTQGVAGFDSYSSSFLKPNPPTPL